MCRSSACFPGCVGTKLRRWWCHKDTVVIETRDVVIGASLPLVCDLLYVSVCVWLKWLCAHMLGSFDDSSAVQSGMRFGCRGRACDVFPWSYMMIDHLNRHIIYLLHSVLWIMLKFQELWCWTRSSELFSVPSSTNWPKILKKIPPSFNVYQWTQSGLKDAFDIMMSDELCKRASHVRSSTWAAHWTLNFARLRIHLTSRLLQWHRNKQSDFLGLWSPRDPQSERRRRRRVLCLTHGPCSFVCLPVYTTGPISVLLLFWIFSGTHECCVGCLSVA